MRHKILAALPLSEHDITARTMWDIGVDPILSDVGRDIVPFACEPNHTSHLRLYESIDQAKANAENEGLLPWAAIFRKDRGETLFLPSLDTVLQHLAVRAASRGYRRVA